MGSATIRAVDGISLQIEAGEFVALLGASGSGKSSLLNLLAGLDSPSAGSVIVETVFARQGIGQLAIDAILSKDYPLMQGVILFTAACYIVLNLLTDISYGYLDPRIRAAR